MSELLVNTIKKADGTGSLTVPAESGTVVTTASPSLGRRNLIINGAMQVAQRGTSATGVSSSGYKTCDRWLFNYNTTIVNTISQDSDAPSGFGSSLKVDCTTADASLAAGNFLIIQHRIEGQNLQGLKYGDSGAEAVTLSFYVKSNKTGAASLGLLQPDNSNKMYSSSYTINSANTWEQKTVTFTGDTSGLINNDNGIGLQIDFFLNSGSNFTTGTLTNDWQALDNVDRNASNLGFGGSTDDYFAITGVQLEVGSVATPFEHRSYGEELALCQRYYQKLFSSTNYGYPTSSIVMAYISTDAFGSVSFAQPMRAAPTLTTTGNFRLSDQSATSAATSVSFDSGRTGIYTTEIGVNTAGSLVTGESYHIQNNNDNTASLNFSAEL